MEAALPKVQELGGTVGETNVEDGEPSTTTFVPLKLRRDDQGLPLGLHQPPRS